MQRCSGSKKAEGVEIRAMQVAPRPPPHQHAMNHQPGAKAPSSAAKGFRSARPGPGGAHMQQQQGWGQQGDAMDVDSRASTGAGITDDGERFLA